MTRRNTLVFVGALAVFFAGSPLIAAYYREPRLELLAEVVAFVFLLVPLRVIPDALLDRELKFELRAGVEMVCKIVAAAVTVVLAVLGYGVWALVVGVLVSRLLTTVLLGWMQPWLVMPTLRVSAVRDLLKEGGALSLASALSFTAFMLPVFVAGPKLGPFALGIYAVAMQFAMLPLSKIMPIVNTIAFPAFSRLQGQQTALGGYVVASLGAGAMLMLPIFVGMAAAGDAFTRGVLGPQWGEAAPSLAALALVMPLRGVSLFLIQVLGGVGRADLVMRCSVALWLLALAASGIGAAFGLGALVAAVACAEVLGCALVLTSVRGALAMRASALATACKPSVLAAVVMGGAVFFTSKVAGGLPPLGVLALQIIVGAAVYAAVLRLLYAAAVKETLRLLTMRRSD